MLFSKYSIVGEVIKTNNATRTDLSYLRALIKI
jgi:hypothetical protein